MDIKDVAKNLIHCVYGTIPIILRNSIKHTRIENLAIKSSNSIALPFWRLQGFEEIIKVSDEE